MNKCCENYNLEFVDGKSCGQGSGIKYKHIKCLSCGKITSGKTWWYDKDGMNEVEVCEALIKEWNVGGLNE